MDEARAMAQDRSVIYPGDLGGDGPRIWNRTEGVGGSEDRGFLAQYKQLGWFAHSAIGLVFLAVFVWMRA